MVTVSAFTPELPPGLIVYVPCGADWVTVVP